MDDQQWNDNQIDICSMARAMQLSTGIQIRRFKNVFFLFCQGRGKKVLDTEALSYLLCWKRKKKKSPKTITPTTVLCTPIPSRWELVNFLEDILWWLASSSKKKSFPSDRKVMIFTKTVLPWRAILKRDNTASCCFFSSCHFFMWLAKNGYKVFYSYMAYIDASCFLTQRNCFLTNSVCFKTKLLKSNHEYSLTTK